MDESTDSGVYGWSLPKVTDHEKQIQSTIKKLIVHKVFVGEYSERHYVDSLKSYRDVVVVAPEEKELIENLKYVQKHVQMNNGTNKWLGITTDMYDGTPRGHCLWVELAQITLGKHWFQVRSVKIKDREIVLRLKCLRPFQTPEVQMPTNADTDATQMQSSEYFDIQKFYNEFELSQAVKLCQDISFQSFHWCFVSLKTILTFQNLGEVIKFSSALILTIITFLAEAVRYLGDYSLKLIHEGAYLIRALTPLLLGILEFFSKCVGGFYLLIAMLWRGSSAPSTPPNALMVAYGKSSRSLQRKSLGYQKDFQYRQDHGSYKQHQETVYVRHH